MLSLANFRRLAGGAYAEKARNMFEALCFFAGMFFLCTASSNLLMAQRSATC